MRLVFAGGIGATICNFFFTRKLNEELQNVKTINSMMQYRFNSLYDEEINALKDIIRILVKTKKSVNLLSVAHSAKYKNADKDVTDAEVDLSNFRDTLNSNIIFIDKHVYNEIDEFRERCFALFGEACAYHLIREPNPNIENSVAFTNNKFNKISTMKANIDNEYSKLLERLRNEVVRIKAGNRSNN